jgi:hypothetical protein
MIRSGWWVVAAAAAVAVFTLALVLSQHPGSDHKGLDASEFDLTSAVVEAELIVRGMPIDGVRALDNPATISPAEIDRYNEEERGKLLVPTDRVIGVAIGSEARAYPLRVMRWHEVVNDSLGGEPIAVTYNPLCDSVAVFSTDRRLGVSGMLFNSNTLVYDQSLPHASSPLWTQLDGRPVAGPEPRNAPGLMPRVAELVTWGDWLARHPETTVLAQETDLKKLYKRDPYHSYFGSDKLRFPVAPMPEEPDLRLKDRVVILTIDGVDTVLPFPGLERTAGSRTGSIELTVDGLALEIGFDADIGVAHVEPLADAHRLEAVRYAFWFAWFSHKRTIPDIIRAAR